MQSICVLPPGGSITVGIGDSGRTFRGGDRIDLDAIAVPARENRPAETWRDVLGEHLAAFLDEAPDASLGLNPPHAVIPGQDIHGDAADEQE